MSLVRTLIEDVPSLDPLYISHYIYFRSCSTLRALDVSPVHEIYRFVIQIVFLHAPTIFALFLPREINSEKCFSS